MSEHFDWEGFRRKRTQDQFNKEYLSHFQESPLVDIVFLKEIENKIPRDVFERLRSCNNKDKVAVDLVYWISKFQIPVNI